MLFFVPESLDSHMNITSQCPSYKNNILTLSGIDVLNPPVWCFIQDQVNSEAICCLCFSTILSLSLLPTSEQLTVRLDLLSFQVLCVYPANNAVAQSTHWIKRGHKHT